jgi:hypothetical protein
MIMVAELTDREFFVTVRDAGRTGFLLGPYQSHGEALKNVERGREAAIAANAWAHFYSFGTASAPAGVVQKTVFGK